MYSNLYCLAGAVGACWLCMTYCPSRSARCGDTVVFSPHRWNHICTSASRFSIIFIRWSNFQYRHFFIRLHFIHGWAAVAPCANLKNTHDLVPHCVFVFACWSVSEFYVYLLFWLYCYFSQTEAEMHISASELILLDARLPSDSTRPVLPEDTTSAPEVSHDYYTILKDLIA